MTSQVHIHIPSNEPSVVVNISQKEVGPEVYRLPYPPELTLKRRVSESFLQTRGYLKKRRKTFRRVHQTTIDCPCLPPPTYDVAMTEPAPNLDSAYSTSPTTLPTPDTQGNESHAQRPSQVTEMIEKVNVRLRRLFGSRRGSAEDELPPLNPTATQRSSMSDSTNGPAEDLYIHCGSEDLAGMGLTALPNVSEYFDINSEVDPSCFYGTTDWDIFQATLRAQRRNTIQAQLNTDLHYDGDSNLKQLERLRQHSTQIDGCGERERKDSQFSFSDFLKPRRFSKVDKGKDQVVYDDGAASTSQDQSLLSLHRDTSSDTVGPSTTQTEVLSRETSDGNLFLASEQPVASFSQIDMASVQASAPVSQKDYNKPLRSEPTTRKVSVRLVPPTSCPRRDQRRLSTSSTASNSSMSSFGSPTLVNRPLRTLRRLAGNMVSTAAANEGGEKVDGHSQPISIPSSYHNIRHSSTVAEASARLTNDSPTLPPSLTSLLTTTTTTTTDLLPHGYRPDTAPSSPSLNPTLIASPEAMQALHLGPPQRALLQRSVLSRSRIFHVSVEQLSITTPTHATSPLEGPFPVAQKGNLARDSDDEPDFSITHPAPPGPLVTDSLPLADVPSPVKRRTGSLEGSGDLRAVYIEQGKASVMKCPPRRRSPRKSLQGRLW